MRATTFAVGGTPTGEKSSRPPQPEHFACLRPVPAREAAAQGTRAVGEETMDPIYVGMVLSIAVLAASVLSVELGLSIAVVEIALGVSVGNTLHIEASNWLVFLASFGGILLTFLAGAEVDPQLLRVKFKQSALIGGLSFLLPFVGVTLFTHFVIGWDLRSAEITGVALSTTSLAVVYAVLVET